MKNAIEELEQRLRDSKQDFVRAYVRLHNDINILANNGNYEHLEQLNKCSELLNSMIAEQTVRKAGYYFNNDSERWEREQEQ